MSRCFQTFSFYYLSTVINDGSVEDDEHQLKLGIILKDFVEVNIISSKTLSSRVVFQREQERQDSAGNQQRTRTRGRRIQLDEFGMPVDDLATEEAIVSERLEAQGASVEFTA